MIEVVVSGIPVSHQTRNRDALRGWKTTVATAAKTAWPNAPLNTKLRLIIVYYYDSEPGDVDNMIKPIQDALNGIFYVDDKQVVDVQCHKRDLNGSFRIRGISETLATGFGTGKDFVYVRVEDQLDPAALV